MDFAYDEWEDEPAFWSNPTRKLYKDNLSRDIIYGYVQDLISVNDSVDIALGLRLDNYSDFGTKLSKRAAIVYRATDTTIFKLLYGSAFRAPTFTEKYHNGHINFRAGDENIQPEETDTYEMQVIYTPNFNHRLSLNMFYADLYNIIDLEEEGDTIPGYQNFDSRTSKGVEFEYNFRTKLEHNFYFNGSYIDTTYTQAKDGSDPEKDLSMPDISKVMFKAMYIYTPISQLSFGTTWRYESETSPTGLWNGDPTSWPRNDGVVEEQHVFDETITYRLSSRSTFRATIKNVFDSEIKNPSYYYSHEGGVLREGRNFFLTYNHVF
jgi:iron complex outermembrane receptor protein